MIPLADLSAIELPIPSGRILTPSGTINSLGNFSHVAGTAYAAPVVVRKRQSFSGLAFAVHTSCTGLNVKMALYSLNDSFVPTLVEAVTGGPYTEAADATKTINFSAATTLYGPYLVAVKTDASQTLKAYGSGPNPVLGMGGLILGGPRISFTSAYADAFPATFTPTFTEGSGMSWLGVVRS